MSAPVRVVWQPVADDPAAADRLLRNETAEVLGRTPDTIHLARHCQHCGSSEHGRPVVVTGRGSRRPGVSLSRAAGVVIVAVSAEHGVGVDIEEIDATWPAGSGSLLLHTEEHAVTTEDRTRTWVRKESLLKATGDGLSVDPSRLRLSDPDEAPALLEWRGGPEGLVATMQDVRIDGYTACVTVLGAGSVEVIEREAAPVAAPR